MQGGKLENQVEKKLANGMESGFMQGVIGIAANIVVFLVDVCCRVPPKNLLRPMC